MSPETERPSITPDLLLRLSSALSNFNAAHAEEHINEIAELGMALGYGRYHKVLSLRNDEVVDVKIALASAISGGVTVQPGFGRFSINNPFGPEPEKLDFAPGTGWATIYYYLATINKS
jgi:hypothetical protein